MTNRRTVRITLDRDDADILTEILRSMIADGYGCEDKETAALWLRVFKAIRRVVPR